MGRGGGGGGGGAKTKIVLVLPPKILYIILLFIETKLGAKCNTMQLGYAREFIINIILFTYLNLYFT